LIKDERDRPEGHLSRNYSRYNIGDDEKCGLVLPGHQPGLVFWVVNYVSLAKSSVSHSIMHEKKHNHIKFLFLRKGSKINT
jgi:hypothetical protein